MILGAGASSRMGRPKLLLPWAGTTILGHLISQWHEAGAAQIAIVLAEGAQTLEPELDRIRFPAEDRVYNPAPQLGMFSTIQCAAIWRGWKSDLTHWIIALGDQPHLQARTLRALLNMGAAHPEQVCQLSREGRPRHPVLLPASAFRSLAGSNRRSLREFLQRLPGGVALEESDDAGLDLDIDTLDDYEKAIQLASEAGRTSSFVP